MNQQKLGAFSEPLSSAFCDAILKPAAEQWDTQEDKINNNVILTSYSKQKDAKFKVILEHGI